MNLIERIARLIDSEGAYGVAFSSTSENASPIPPSIRQKYFQSKYEHEATQIAKIILNAGPDKLRNDLVDFDVETWGKLGLPANCLRDMVEQKHAV